jgi:hypothetical protein
VLTNLKEKAMKEELIKKLNFMNLLYSAGRIEMFQEQWSELAKLIDNLPEDKK